MFRKAIVVGLLAAMSAGPVLADPRTQLEGAAGIPLDERGKYSILQLQQILAVQNRRDRPEGQKQRAIRIIKAGKSLQITL